MHQKQPLPSVGMLDRAHALDALKCIVAAVPLRIELKDMLEGTRVFEPPSCAEEALAKISLAFACQVLRPALDLNVDVDSGMATAHRPSEEREGRHPPRKRSRGDMTIAASDSNLPKVDERIWKPPPSQVRVWPLPRP